MRRVVVAGAVAVVSLLIGWSPATSQESAATITEVGWWTSNQASNAPQGGVAVSAGPAGTISLAALRVSVNVDSLDSAGLSLKEAGGIQQSGAQLQVCTTPNAWTAGPKQALDKAPKPECDRAKAPLSRQADGTWTADVRLLLSDAATPAKTVSLMIVPAGAGSVPVGFEVQFAPPSLSASGKSTSGSPAATTSDSFASSGEFDSSSASSPATPSADRSSSFNAGSSDERPSVPSSGFAASSTGSSFTSLGGAVTGPTEGEAVAEAIVDASAPAAPAATFLRPTSTTSVPTGRGSRGAQALFFVMVAALVAVVAGLGHARFAPFTSAN